MFFCAWPATWSTCNYVKKCRLKQVNKEHLYMQNSKYVLSKMITSPQRKETHKDYHYYSMHVLLPAPSIVFFTFLIH